MVSWCTPLRRLAGGEGSPCTMMHVLSLLSFVLLVGHGSTGDRRSALYPPQGRCPTITVRIMSTRHRHAPLPRELACAVPTRTGAQASRQSDHFHPSTTATRPSTGSCGRHTPSAVKRHQGNATHSRPPGAPSSPTSTSLSFAPAYAFRPSDMGFAASKRSTATRPVRI